MNTIALSQNKRLILAGLLAAALLFVSQISVRAYEFEGGFNSVRTIGGYPVLTIGAALSDESALNIGDYHEPFTMPSVVTGGITNLLSNVSGTYATLNGNISNTGVASDFYRSFEWGLTPAYGNTTPEVVQAAIGSFSANLAGLTPGVTYHVRARTRVGSVYSYGADRTFTVPPNGTWTSMYDIAAIFGIVVFIGLFTLLGVAIKQSNGSLHLSIEVGSTIAILGLLGLVGLIFMIQLIMAQFG